MTEHLDEVREALLRRGFDDAVALDRLVELAKARRKVIGEVEALRAKRNETSKAMGRMADKKSAAFAELREAMRHVGEDEKTLEQEQRDVERDLDEILAGLPNLPHADTPDGLSESHNVELRVVGEKPALAFAAKDHVELGVALDILDFERGAKISGARFTVLKGAGARLERALMMFMLDLHADEHGYTEVWPPVLVKDSAMRGTGQLPKFADDAFEIQRDENWEKETNAGGHRLFLVPTAEVPVTNLHADEILSGAELPIAYTAYTACFRKEAGSYGKDTRGLVRQHQFDKVELVRFCTPEAAASELELLTGHAEQVLQRLGLHYRVVQLCAGDMGFAATKTYDLEVWLPGQDAYREISSCSWFGDFQARRARIRFKSTPKAKPQLVHTLNGSGLAIGRTLIAILEQCQQADGTVLVPAVLRPYMGGMSKLAPVEST